MVIGGVNGFLDVFRDLSWLVPLKALRLDRISLLVY
jgi:hypothetical protein